VQAILGVIMACHALSQENLPYHVKSVEVCTGLAQSVGKNIVLGLP
jgi:hypothetical protein